MFLAGIRSGKGANGQLSEMMQSVQAWFVRKDRMAHKPDGKAILEKVSHTQEVARWTDGWKDGDRIHKYMKHLQHKQEQEVCVTYEGNQFLRWAFSCLFLLHGTDCLTSQAVTCLLHAFSFPIWSNSTSVSIVIACVNEPWMKSKRSGEHKAETEAGFKCMDDKDPSVLGSCLFWTYLQAYITLSTVSREYIYLCNCRGCFGS